MKKGILIAWLVLIGLVIITVAKALNTECLGPAESVLDWYTRSC